MQTNNKHIKKQFEKSMKVYDKNASVQDIMGEKLLAELSKLSTSFDNILEIGSGTGLLTKKLSKKIIFKTYFANDLVEKSKSYVQKIIPDVKFLAGNALKIKPSKKLDLIISNAVFQWFDNLDKAIEILKLSLSQNGIIAFTTFSPENFKELTSVTGLTLKYKTTEEIIEILEQNNFEIIYSEDFYKTLKFNTPLELLAHLKNTGVNSLSETTWTVKKVKDFCDNFSKKYTQPQLTYTPIIIIARKK
jgi:malonyl-ACP O-methyltransferase BioC